MRSRPRRSYRELDDDDDDDDGNGDARGQQGVQYGRVDVKRETTRRRSARAEGKPRKRYTEAGENGDGDDDGTVVDSEAVSEDDIDGAPMADGGSDDDDIDGALLDEDLDGVPMDE